MTDWVLYGGIVLVHKLELIGGHRMRKKKEEKGGMEIKQASGERTTS